MDRGAWRATVRGGSQRVGQHWAADIERKERTSDPLVYSSVLCGELNGKKIKKNSGDLCISIADAHRYTVEMNTTLQSNYTPIKTN